MNKRNRLQEQIERLREDLNKSIIKEPYEVYYAKSVALDKLFEEYIELKNE